MISVTPVYSRNRSNHSCESCRLLNPMRNISGIDQNEKLAHFGVTHVAASDVY